MLFVYQRETVVDDDDERTIDERTASTDGLASADRERIEKT
jgi:hypothetical protein